jgi:hypothetical protein
MGSYFLLIIDSFSIIPQTWPPGGQRCLHVSRPRPVASLHHAVLTLTDIFVSGITHLCAVRGNLMLMCKSDSSLVSTACMVQAKLKISLYTTWRLVKWIGGLAPLILNLGTRRGHWSASPLRLFTPGARLNRFLWPHREYAKIWNSYWNLFSAVSQTSALDSVQYRGPSGGASCTHCTLSSTEGHQEVLAVPTVLCPVQRAIRRY